MIPEKLLLKHGALVRHYEKGESIFSEGARASNYFQIKSGKIKMASINHEGKEVIQKVFHSGESFGEPPLLGDFRYPAGAETLSKTSILVLHKDAFKGLLNDTPELADHFFKLLVSRLRYKSKILTLVSQFKAKDRILRFLEMLAGEEALGEMSGCYKVKLSRQQIADSLGLRVETTIRAVKKLQAEGAIDIVAGKILMIESRINHRA